MPQYDFMQVDAFTTEPLGGNPCAILFDAHTLSVAQMQAIALEMNLSETAFIMPSDKADFRLRYFTPSEEIPLAGHPTIASVYALIQSGRLNPAQGLSSIQLELTAGVITVEIERIDDEVRQIIMQQKKPEFYESLPIEEVAPVFGLSPNDLLPEPLPQIVSTGTRQLMIAVKDHAVLRRAVMDFEAYRALRSKFKFFSPHLFCTQGVTADGQTFARHFGLPPDTLEDPFTGSATGGMAAYLWHYGLIATPEFIAEQGHWMGRPGRATVQIVGSRDAIDTVKVGGQAALLIKGQLALAD